MFSKTYRLPFSTRFIKPNTFHSPLFVFKIIPNNSGNNRYGFVIGKTVDKRSVYRNAAKRRFRAVLESLHPMLKQGYDMLFILKRDVKEKTYEEIKEELTVCLKKRNIIAK